MPTGSICEVFLLSPKRKAEMKKKIRGKNNSANGKKKNKKKKKHPPTHASFNFNALEITVGQLDSCLDDPSCTNSTLTLHVWFVCSLGNRNRSSGGPLWKAPEPSRSGSWKMASAQWK